LLSNSITYRIETINLSTIYVPFYITFQEQTFFYFYKHNKSYFGFRFNKLQDRNNMALLMYDSSTRWTTVRIDSVCLLISISTFLLVTLAPLEGTTSGVAALALTYAVSVSFHTIFPKFETTEISLITVGK